MMDFHQTGDENIILVSKRSAESWEMPKPEFHHVSEAVEFSMDSPKDGLMASALTDPAGNLASITLVPLALDGPTTRVYSSSDYIISCC